MDSNKKIYEEIEECLIKDDKPSVKLNDMMKSGKLKEYPFNMLSDLINTEQNLKYHPEGNVWNHTLLVVDEAAKRREKSENPRIFMWAALLHDIGKAPTTQIRKGRVTSYKHEIVGKDMANDFLKEFIENSDFIEKVKELVRWHMEPLFVNKNLPFANIKQMLEEVSLEEISLLSLCDRFGRGEMTKEKMEEERKAIDYFIENCRKSEKEIAVGNYK